MIRIPPWSTQSRSSAASDLYKRQVTLFLMEISLGLLSRLIPQINVFIEGMPIKILVTMMVLGFSLGAIAASVATIFKGMDMEILRIMKNMV